MPDPAEPYHATLILRSFAEADAGMRALFDRSDHAEGSWGWFRTLADTTLAKGERALIAALSGIDGAVIAALPLAIAANGVWRGLTAPYTTRFAPALPDPVSARALGRQLARAIPRLLRLEALDPEDAGCAALAQGLRQSRLVVEDHPHFGNWYEPVAGFDGWQARRGSRLKETVRRRRGRLVRDGRFGFRCLRGRAEIAEAATIYEQIYAESWKVPEPHPLFMPRLFDALTIEDSLRLGVLSIDGAPVAAQIWLVRGGRATIFKLAHRESAASHSPGTILTWMMAEALLAAEPITEIDFGRGDDDYKRDWLSERRERCGLIAANPASLAGLAAILRDILPPRLKKLATGRRSGMVAA